MVPKGHIKEGDRVRLKADHTATGTVDELWLETPDKIMASVVWDESGCVGEGPFEDLELLEDE